MSLFQPKETFHNGNSPDDEVFRLAPHGCEVMFTCYEKNSVVGPSINTRHAKHLIISGSVDVTVDGVNKQYKTSEWFEIPGQKEHQIKYLSDCSIIEFWFDE